MKIKQRAAVCRNFSSTCMQHIYIFECTKNKMLNKTSIEIVQFFAHKTGE